MAKAKGKFDGHVLQVVTSGLATGWQTVSTAYNSSSNPTLMSKTITPKGKDSNFLITISFSGSHSSASNNRSQIMLTNNDYNHSNSPLWYNHYGLYYAHSYEHFAPYTIVHLDTTQSSVIGTDITYKVFGGIIGSGFSQKFFHKEITIMEIAR